MKPAACTAVVLAVLLAAFLFLIRVFADIGASLTEAQMRMRDYRGHSLDLPVLRLLADQPWASNHRWDRIPRIDLHLNNDLEQRIPRPLDSDDAGVNMDNDLRVASEKRSAVATALNSGRRRRQPTPALGKAVTPYVGVGVLNDVGSFFDSLRDNLETLASLSPHQRSTLFQDAPSVVHAPSAGGGGGGGSGIRKLHALRPLRPTGNIRSYNRRSIVEADGVYPGANHHDPGLLWTGLGR